MSEGIGSPNSVVEFFDHAAQLSKAHTDLFLGEEEHTFEIGSYKGPNSIWTFITITNETGENLLCGRVNKDSVRFDPVTRLALPFDTFVVVKEPADGSVGISELREHILAHRLRADIPLTEFDLPAQALSSSPRQLERQGINLTYVPLDTTLGRIVENSSLLGEFFLEAGRLTPQDSYITGSTTGAEAENGHEGTVTIRGLARSLYEGNTTVIKPGVKLAKDAFSRLYRSVDTTVANNVQPRSPSTAEALSSGESDYLFAVEGDKSTTILTIGAVSVTKVDIPASLDNALSTWQARTRTARQARAQLTGQAQVLRNQQLEPYIDLLETPGK